MKVILPKEYEWMDISDPEYRNTLERILYTNQNLNIIGNAGSGKSTLLKLITQMLMEFGNNVVLLSSTGISAVNISTEKVGASTIHSFFNFAPHDFHDISSISDDGFLYQKINSTDIFIIDEVSMVNSSLFDYIVETVKHYKNGRKLPRFILFSDILQLPPIVKDVKEVKEYFYEMYKGKVFFFNSVNFVDLGFRTCILSHIYRQKEGNFQSILNRIREGTFTNEDIAIINEHVVDEREYFKSNPLYMNLATTNKTVNKLNEDYTKTFSTPPMSYHAKIKGEFPIPYNSVLSNLVIIKPGMQVMCLKNNTGQRYQNGTIGEVTSTRPDMITINTTNDEILNVVQETWFNYKYVTENKKIVPLKVGEFKQIGAKVAAAITVHKSQGQTFDRIYFDIENFCPESIIYVALSRLRSIDGLGLKNKLQGYHIKVNEEALDFLSSV